ncbi:MAG: AgmX/PglI C-terminal domain-containing protein [Proteobacteria bacterium]|jgi:hypothetical protein|nr:AgmX/PglI C-terminal domain-containing protein [Pseudomonadota bacterium]
MGHVRVGPESSSERVLRLGIVINHRIVGEKLIKPKAEIIVGESAQADIVFPETHLPPRFSLFRRRGHRWYLRLTESMGGRLSAGQQAYTIAELRSSPDAVRRGDTWEVELTEKYRGKLVIDQVAVLFQFVSPPPASVTKQIKGMDFRPRYMEDEDPTYMGFLAIWSALAVVFMIWVWQTEPMEYTLEEIPDRFTHLILEKPEAQVTPPKEDPVENAESDPEPDADSDPLPEADTDPQPESNEPVSEVGRIKDLEERKHNMLNTNPLFAGIIGQRGDGENKLGLPFLDGGLDEEIDRLLAEQAKEAGQYVALDPELRGPSTNYEAATIADPNQIGGGRGTLEEGPELTATHTIETDEQETQHVPGDIKSTVRQYLPQLKYCYEMRLKEKPDLHGKVAMAWTIEAGQVVDVFTMENLTGDDQLSSCIERKIKRWRFPETSEGDVNWPFVFRS